MNRRQFVTAVALACGAGCAGNSTPTDSNIESADRTKTTPRAQTATSEREQTPSLREREVPLLDLGESYAWSASVDIWIDSVEFSRTLRMQNGEELSPSTAMAVLEVPVYTKSTTGESEPVENPLQSSSWTLLTEQGQYEPHAPTDGRPVGSANDDVASDAEIETHPVESTVGSLLFEVPRETTEYRLVLTDAETNRPVVAWSGAVDAADFPELTITEINADAQGPDNQVQVAVGFYNGEPTTEVFYPTVSIRGMDGTELVTREPSFELHPYTKTAVEYTVPITPAEARELQVDISPGPKTTVPIVSVRKSWWGYYTMANGLDLSLAGTWNRDRVPGRSGESEGASASAGPHKYVSVNITVGNPTDLKHQLPALDWFELDNPIALNGFSPLEQSSYHEPDREKIEPRETIRGILYFSVPKETFVPSSNCRGEFPLDSDWTEICEWGPD